MSYFIANNMIDREEFHGVIYIANGYMINSPRTYELIDLTSEFVDFQIDLDSEVDDGNIEATSNIDSQVEVTSRIIPPEQLP